ncbi:MAG: radical SAM protein [Oligoflexia bacterium]|nr:radical SAM protein [Oligoflexia bacterium]
MLNFERNSYLAINPAYRLRNDKSMIIAFLLSTEAISYRYFDPQAGLVASLLNGKRTIQEVIDILKDVCRNDPAEKIESYVQYALESMEKTDANNPPFLLSSNSTSIENCIDYDPCEFIVNQQDYNPIWDRLGIPIQLLVMITGACQTNCKYCYSDLTNLRSMPIIPKEEWIKIFRQAKENYKIQLLGLTGGDPWAHPEAALIWAEACKLDLLFFLSTKCHVDYSDAKLLVDSGFLSKVNNYGIRRFQIR